MAGPNPTETLAELLKDHPVLPGAVEILQTTPTQEELERTVRFISRGLSAKQKKIVVNATSELRRG